jgi:hypothetical protein
VRAGNRCAGSGRKQLREPLHKFQIHNQFV